VEILTVAQNVDIFTAVQTFIHNSHWLLSLVLFFFFVISIFSFCKFERS